MKSEYMKKLSDVSLFCLREDLLTVEIYTFGCPISMTALAMEYGL